MAYRVRIESFEGPFDLLLYLVSRQKVDIGSISIAQIADQYLAEVRAMKSLDLDVASDFLLVASTLLEIKATSLLPQDKSDLEEEIAELAPNDARDMLVSRLVTYKQYKNAAEALTERFEEEGRLHTRSFGPSEEFQGLMPDFLRSVTLEKLGQQAASALARREVFLLDAEHIAAKPIPVEVYVRSIFRRIKKYQHLRFSDLVAKNTPPDVVVVSFLAILELYKRMMVTLVQNEEFGDIVIDYIEGSADLDMGQRETTIQTARE